jgi:acetolactate synthase-1/2/3 large subunit
MYMTELTTLVRHKLPLFIMVSNDGGWGANRHSQFANIGRNIGVDFDVSRYDLVARDLGLHGELAESPADIGGAMERAMGAFREGQPALLNAIIDQWSGKALQDPRISGVATKNWPRTRVPVGNRPIG